jgi:hypothetical protein
MESFLTRGGYTALVLFSFLESCYVPMSSEATSGLAGMPAYQGHLSLALVIVPGTPASWPAPAASTAPDLMIKPRMRAACPAVISLDTPPGTGSHSMACSPQAERGTARAGPGTGASLSMTRSPMVPDVQQLGRGMALGGLRMIPCRAVPGRCEEVMG